MPELARAAKCVGKCRIAVVERAAPALGRDELLVRVAFCALCGSDRRAWTEGSSVVPGHEISGTIEAVAEGVTGLPLGTPGVVYLLDFCGACAACRVGSTNLCSRRRAMYGFTSDGGFADHVRVSSRCFVPVPADLDLAHATALLDLFGTTLHALRRGGFEPGGAVAVLGCGPIGVGAIAVARALGAARIYATDVAPYRLAIAKRLGATVVDARDSDPVATIRRLEPDGVPVAVEAAGCPETQRQAIALAAIGGRAVAVAHSPAPVSIDVSRDLIAREIGLVGAEYFPIGQIGEVVALVREGQLDPGPLITHRYPLADADAAYRTFFGGETAKVVIAP